MIRNSLVIMLLLCTLQAKAQQDDTSRVATARVLFEEGLQFSDSAQWELAINRFRQTLRLRDSPQVRYNLALALNEHGQLVEASEELNIITNHPGVAEDIRVGASDLLASIVPRLARVQLALDGDLSNAEISMDGRSIDTALLNVPIICNPGTHRIVISRESADLEAREITAISGRVVEMRFAIPDAATPVALLGETAPEQPQPLVRQWWFWTAIGAVVAGSVTAIILAQEPGAPSPVIGDLNPGELVFE